ncbi:MAG: type II secretion system protein GspM [Casimicrobiaceae bacterium]
MNIVTRTLERQSWWQRASHRERVALVSAFAIVSVALLASYVALPLRDALVRAPQERALRTALLAQAQLRVTEIANARPPSTAAIDARSAIERALDHQHIGRSDVTIDSTTARIGVTLSAVSLGDAAALIDSLAHEGLRVTDATLAARADAPLLRAELTFSRPAP